MNSMVFLLWQLHLNPLTRAQKDFEVVFVPGLSSPNPTPPQRARNRTAHRSQRSPMIRMRERESNGSFRQLGGGGTLFGILMIEILIFKVLCKGQGPLSSETPKYRTYRVSADRESSSCEPRAQQLYPKP